MGPEVRRVTGPEDFLLPILHDPVRAEIEEAVAAYIDRLTGGESLDPPAVLKRGLSVP